MRERESINDDAGHNGLVKPRRCTFSKIIALQLALMLTQSFLYTTTDVWMVAHDINHTYRALMREWVYACQALASLLFLM